MKTPTQTIKTYIQSFGSSNLAMKRLLKISLVVSSLATASDYTGYVILRCEQGDIQVIDAAKVIAFRPGGIIELKQWDPEINDYRVRRSFLADNCEVEAEHEIPRATDI